MAKIGDNIIGESVLNPFFRVENGDSLGIDLPENRLGNSQRTVVRSLSGFQKEALVRATKDITYLETSFR